MATGDEGSRFSQPCHLASSCVWIYPAMEQDISEEIDHGRDIAKAYRLVREKKWRIAMIYLNHLANKYPNWDSIYMLKSITHYILHEPVFMQQALGEACRLGNQIACDDLQNSK